MELHKIGIKFFAQGSDNLNLVDLIPVFHRWIQTGAVDDVLIDVADYSHVHHGPGVLIIAHEGNYAFDETQGQRGVLYYSKHPLEGDLQARLASVARKALKACRTLAGERELNPRVAIPGDQIEIFANDRLLAPNNDATYQALAPAIEAFLARLYPGGSFELVREPDPRERFSVRVKVGEPVAVDTLLERLAA